MEPTCISGFWKRNAVGDGNLHHEIPKSVHCNRKKDVTNIYQFDEEQGQVLRSLDPTFSRTFRRTCLVLWYTGTYGGLRKLEYAGRSMVFVKEPTDGSASSQSRLKNPAEKSDSKVVEAPE